MAQSRASHFSNALIKEKMLPIPGTMTGRKRRSQSRLGPLGPSGQRGRKLKKVLRKVAFRGSERQTTLKLPASTRRRRCSLEVFQRQKRKVWLLERSILRISATMSFGWKHLPFQCVSFCPITIKWTFSFCTLTHFRRLGRERVAEAIFSKILVFNPDSNVLNHRRSSNILHTSNRRNECGISVWPSVVPATHNGPADLSC